MTSEAVPADQETNERRRLRRAMLLVLAVSVAMAVLAYLLWPQAEPPRQLPIAEAISIEFDLIGTSGGQDPGAGREERREVFEPLLQVFNSGVEIPDHRCGDTGHVIVRMRDGSEWHYGLLSGHDQRYFHIRQYDGLRYRIFRVDRPVYAAAMKLLGVERIGDARPET